MHQNTASSLIILYSEHYRMSIYRYSPMEDDDGQEGFEKNPTMSEEIIVENNRSMQVEPTHLSIAPFCNKTKHRYSSNQKPSFKLKPLEEKLKGTKTSDSNIGKFRPKMLKDSLETQKEETSSPNNFTLPRRIKKATLVDPLSSIETLLQSVVIKTTRYKMAQSRTQIAESIPIAVDNQQQKEIIAEQAIRYPKAKVVYRQSLQENTHAFFKHLLRDNRQSNFVASKYNLALRVKMQKTKNLPENNTNVSPANDIEFRGDFESGNLSCAMKVSQDTYNLHLRIDTNTRGHQSWFYFKAINHQSEVKRIKINICNMTRRFRLFEKGQKIYVQTLSPPSPWIALDQNIVIQADGKKRYKISFELDLQPKQQTMVSLIPPYTYSQLLKEVQEFEKSPNVKVDILTHSVTGLAIPLLTITKGAARQRKTKANLKKKVLLVSGRIHPSETCSSYIISGLIRELLAESEQNEQFLNNNIVKIIPMLNPDGVVFGNFRTNYLGDDLNRSFYKNDETAFPQTTGLKQLGKNLQNQYGQNFIGFFDMHGHSGRPNSFIYGPEHEQGSQQHLQTRIFPKILDKLSRYFKYQLSTFKLEQYKFNTARGFFIRKLRVPAYTIQTSYALFLDKKQPKSRLQQMSIAQWIYFGHEIVSAFHSYLKYLQISKQSSSIFKKGKQRRLNPEEKNKDSKSLSCIDFHMLKKQIEKESLMKQKEDKFNEKEELSQDSDGESEEEDLPPAQKLIIIKQYKQTTIPSFLLPKMPKTSMPLPSVVPSILNGRKNEILSTIPKLGNKYRHKKLIKPLNLSYEYTQYLLKNIAVVGSLQPEVINFGFRQPEGANKKHSN